MKISNTSMRIKQVMKDNGLKQIDILRLAEPYIKLYNEKLEKNALSQYVSGKVEPGQKKLTILGLALNVNEAWLMGYDVPKERIETIKSEVYPNKDSLNELHKDFTLTDDEKNLIIDFRNLNDEGKEKLIDSLDDLIQSGKYKKYISYELDTKEA